MDSDRRGHLEEERQAYRERLNKLKEYTAKFGMHTPPHVLTEIDSIYNKLTDLDSRLGPATPLTVRDPVRDFVGREVEIDRLIQLLGPSADHSRAATITGVRGMGGVGKTELAYAVAQRLSSQFPDGQISVELRGASNDPRVYSD